MAIDIRDPDGPDGPEDTGVHSVSDTGAVAGHTPHIPLVLDWGGTGPNPLDVIDTDGLLSEENQEFLAQVAFGGDIEDAKVILQRLGLDSDLPSLEHATDVLKSLGNDLLDALRETLQIPVLIVVPSSFTRHFTALHGQGKITGNFSNRSMFFGGNGASNGFSMGIIEGSDELLPQRQDLVAAIYFNIYNGLSRIGLRLPHADELLLLNMLNEMRLSGEQKIISPQFFSILDAGAPNPDKRIPVVTSSGIPNFFMLPPDQAAHLPCVARPGAFVNVTIE